MIGLRRKVPIFLQTEASECGLCSLAMVADYLGCRTDLASLRLRFPISRKGATLQSLIQIARALKLDSRPLKLDMHNLPQLRLPCVIHWDMDHFVVLVSVSGRRAVIHDPAIGVRSFTMEEFSKHFTGIALELSPATDFTPTDQKLHFTLRGLMGHITGLKRGLGQILLLALGLETIAIALPFFLQWVVDHALVSADRDLLTTLALGFGLLVLIQAAISAVRGWFVAAISTQLNFQWLGNVFAHLVKLPLEYFEKRHVGNIMSRFGSITTIQKTLTGGFVQAMVDGLMVAGTFGMMLLYSPRLASVSLIAVAIYALMRWALFHGLRTATSEQIIHAAKQTTHFFETASGIQSIRLFDKGEQRRSGWLNILAEQFNAELRIHRIRISYETAQTLLFGLERVLVVWLAASAVLDRSFTAGMLFAFIAYKDQFSTRLAALVDKIVEFKMLKLHGERVADIVMAEAEVMSGHEADEVDLTQVTPSIELRGISFRYSPTEPYVFENIDLRIEAGECVAITGISGCGKTTLVKVMLGLLMPTHGEVLVGGKPIQRLGLTAYRQMIGTVMQEDRLFSGSIADNISFFNPLPEWDRIKESARLAAIDTEVESMPMGYNTITGDSGVGISGGQKQRILLARALYRQPSILVLDEATSELDIANEKSVNATVKSMGLTRIVVAHRSETIATADRIISVKGGKLVCHDDNFSLTKCTA
ncbi:peptidase domain-containing ABC transporter [Pseudoduganella namucuonensis]|uniref:Cyclolysin secretion/processing ATP-binding protein CyaB n=1 Tax=Pseudoduganella namucuonensis TaxID=1035707 RepID=A0A1I7HRD2_9BURK|nr:peptidase domain-containing ABC transporter [Pseudoduganella namucuonensis]SFU63209.1 colicin V processing peptidase. Cysteine peptidase. MEROPS family C39 [Pseudoduganella namucuonensis]